MIDSVKFEVCAGRGGDGSVSFRREKFVPRGGPDGGDGGRGGAVVIRADRGRATLREYSDGRARAAVDGGNGGSKLRHGANGAELELRVPVGSVLWDTERGEGAEPLADLSEDGMAVVICRGGRGGWGNKRFTTSTRQAPQFAQSGEVGEWRQLRIELKLLADVGLIGLPNAGKSTLLRAWSAARPKVAAYPFTTLEPELGVVEVVEVDGGSFVAADMPGLIEGASRGAGLGHEFLRHIERTRVLVHVIDLTADDPLAGRALIDGELAAFGHGLDAKPQLLALNKVDLPDGRAQLELLQEQGEPHGPAVTISALTTEGTRELARRTLQLLRQQREVEAAERPLPVLRPEPRRARFTVTRDGRSGMVVVDGRSVEHWARTLDLDDREARYELLQRLRRMGVARALQRQGVVAGEVVRIGEVELMWEG
ncbi:MAG: GTPase ObgE [Dehalococcoidia bacterium]|nr:GTPase ObgE [Dehalococcoidia bacterium]